MPGKLGFRTEAVYLLAKSNSSAAGRLTFGRIHPFDHIQTQGTQNPEGRDEEGGGSGVRDGKTHVHPWLIHVNVWQKPPQYCNLISLQLK